MTVLLITNAYPNPWKPYGGIFIERQVRALEESQRVAVRVLSHGDSRRGFPRSWIKYVALILKAVQHGLVGDFDVIHAHEVFPAGLISLLTKYLQGGKLVLTVHGDSVYTQERRSQWFGALLAFVLSRADRVIAVSRQIKAELVAAYGVAEDRIHIANMGVDVETFHPQPQAEMRDALGLPQGRRILLFVGNLRKEKGADYLLRALPAVKAKHDHLLCLVGQGEQEAVLREQCRRLGIEALVRFAGGRPPEEVPRWMSAADLLVVPSLSEGFGLAALEAMACGTPVIASRVGGLPEFVHDGVNGLLVEPARPDDLSDKISSLLGNEELRQQLARNARPTALEHSVQIQASRVIMAYDTLCGGRS